MWRTQPRLLAYLHYVAEYRHTVLWCLQYQGTQSHVAKLRRLKGQIKGRYYRHGPRGSGLHTGQTEGSRHLGRNTAPTIWEIYCFLSGVDFKAERMRWVRGGLDRDGDPPGDVPPPGMSPPAMPLSDIHPQAWIWTEPKPKSANKFFTLDWWCSIRTY